MYCQKCGSEVKNGNFCLNCGNRLDASSVACYCSNCGAALEDGSEVCAACGAKVEGGYKKADVSKYGIGHEAKDAETISDGKPKKAKSKKTVIGIIAGVVVAAAVVVGLGFHFGWFGGADGPQVASNVTAAPEDVFKQGEPIKIMTKAYNLTSASKDSPVLKRLEEVIGAELDINWIQEQNYGAEVASVIGSGKYPHVMLIGAVSPAFIQAIRSDMFWDISDIFDDPEKYPNLSKAKEEVNHNISIDGKIYGLYRLRTIGRAGVSIRKDWLDNLGLKMPETVDDLSATLKAFTENDPDGNGVNDTYGMTLTNYIDGPVNNLAVWCGAPNGWGPDEAGELKPAYMFDEYMNALKLMREWYQKGYINSDVSTLQSDRWNDDFLNGKSGLIIDVADRARRLAPQIANIDPQAVVDVFGYVRKDSSTPPVTLPTSGYDSYYVFPKSTIKTREDLEYILGVMDKLNSPEAINLMNFGIEGMHYSKDSEGYVVIANNDLLAADYNDLNQISMDVGATTESLTTRYLTPVAEKVDKVYEENEKYALYNLAAPYMSVTYSNDSTQLDAILYEANLKFITGEITEEDYKAEIEKWKSSGGDKIIKEINEEYKKDASVK